ncbi:THO complex subunit 1 transcription elongation factor-domain-containing protein [Lentinula edodes]|uniref:THO complex subunit 1 transcription elongation factor-domain-containing protein n=1 Tax=Lentinula edodes TaxID=5353 RepID=UPI001E8D795F|nr:THO complex subunit 1 transcription elongation factor-domain-containing protein [Lentinula edodes]KAH7874502.1 THO complex subunit 1 transcription elongation factor-domain-containing protein [Lentinula edodes]
MAKDTIELIYGRLLDSLATSNVFQNTDALISLVQSALSDASSNTTSNPDNRRMKWEYLIKRDVFQHATLEGKALASSSNEDAEKYYAKLQDWLDLALVFTELGATEASYAFSVVQDLLETQTIPSCMKIFDWIERRSRDRVSTIINTTTSSVTATSSSLSSADLGSGRLTSGMQPQKGKALVLLRMLNDLLRRLSKAGGETIGFSGRILTYLSQVFPLGERSGVNLRGEYGPTWEMPVRDSEEKETTENAENDDFYSTFWSIQLPFSKPSVFATPNPPITFAQFQDAVDRVLPVIKEATAKERAMMGAGRSASTMGPATLKRKRGQGEETVVTGNVNKKAMEYFFAKFLTSPELLDQELADTHFRRQILFQLLILLDHLLTHTKTEKAKWITTKNRSLHMPIPEWSLDDALNYTGPVDVNATIVTGPSATSGLDAMKGTGTSTSVTTTAVTGTKITEKNAKNTPAKPSNSKPSSLSAPTALPTASATSTSVPASIPLPSTNTTNITTTPSSNAQHVDKPERMDPIKWTHLTISRTIEELRQTQPPPLSSAGVSGPASSTAGVTAINGLTGREFASTVQSLLEREKGWIRWKNELCDGTVFEKGVWEPSDELLDSLNSVEGGKDEEGMKLDDENKAAGDAEGKEGRRKKPKTKTMYEASRGLRAKMRGPFYSTEENQRDWQWDLGTEALTEIWTMGYRGLEDLERGFSPGTPHDFLHELHLQEQRIELRTKTLRAHQERRLQMERAAREKIEKAEREAKEKEAQAMHEKGDVDMTDVKKECNDVEMKSPENGLLPSVKTELLPQPIPVHVSSIHPSLPPKPGSRAVSPLKPATPVPNALPTSAPVVSTITMPKTTAVASTPAPTVLALPQDEQIRKAEENKTRITWLALRSARDSAQGHLVHFSKIGAGDVRMLCEEIDKAEREREEKEKAEKDEKEGSMSVDQPDVDKDLETDEKVEKEGELDPPGLGFSGPQVQELDTESDVKME